MQNLAVLPSNPKPRRVSELLADLDHWAGRLTPGSYDSDDQLFRLVAKLPRELWDECRSTAERKARALHYQDFCVLLLELALEKESDQHLNAYRLGGGGSGGHGKGTKDLDLDRGLPPNTPVSWKMSRSSSGVMPEMSRATCSTPLTYDFVGHSAAKTALTLPHSI